MGFLFLDVDDTDWKIKISSLKGALQSLGPKVMSVAGQILTRNLVDITPVKTGRLRASIQTTITETYAQVETTAGYGKFVDEDTAPHDIYARFARFLRIPLPNGEVIYRTHVRHPGTKGQNLRERTVETSAPEISDAIGQIYQQDVIMV